MSDADNSGMSAHFREVDGAIIYCRDRPAWIRLECGAAMPSASVAVPSFGGGPNFFTPLLAAIVSVFPSLVCIFSSLLFMDFARANEPSPAAAIITVDASVGVSKSAMLCTI